MNNDKQPRIVEGHESVTQIIGNAIGLFPLGDIAVTPRIMECMSPDEHLGFLLRHATGDWGECEVEDWKINDEAVVEGRSILSVYRTVKGLVFYMITDACREMTVSMLPDEY